MYFSEEYPLTSQDRFFTGYIKSLRKTTYKTLAEKGDVITCLECHEVPRKEWRIPVTLCNEHFLRLLHDLEQVGLDPRIMK
jgi:hypothetical protein